MSGPFALGPYITEGLLLLAAQENIGVDWFYLHRDVTHLGCVPGLLFPLLVQLEPVFLLGGPRAEKMRHWAAEWLAACIPGTMNDLCTHEQNWKKDSHFYREPKSLSLQVYCPKISRKMSFGGLKAIVTRQAGPYPSLLPALGLRDTCCDIHGGYLLCVCCF